MSEPTTDLATVAPPDLTAIDPGDLDRIARLGMWMAAAEGKSTDPKAKGMAAALRIANAVGMGLPPWAAGDIHYIDGSVSLSARMKRALCPAHGLHVRLVDSGPEFCTAAVVWMETGVELGRTTYTMEMAERDGLSGKHNWKKMPERMLWARASGRVVDDFAPWVSMGLPGSRVVTGEEVVAQGALEDEGEPFEVIDQ